MSHLPLRFGSSMGSLHVPSFTGLGFHAPPSVSYQAFNLWGSPFLWLIAKGFRTIKVPVVANRSQKCHGSTVISYIQREPQPLDCVQETCPMLKPRSQEAQPSASWPGWRRMLPRTQRERELSLRQPMGRGQLTSDAEISA